MGEITIDQIENIIIQQGSYRYKLIHEDNEWIFLNLKDNYKNRGYTKESAYKTVLSSSSEIISIPKKNNKYELWD